jgi:surface antigen
MVAMKKITLMKCTTLALAIGLTLTGCSTNTREQNTFLGAGTGAVAGGLLGSIATGAGSGWIIAGGALVGGLIGGLVGNSVDSNDSTQMNSALDDNSIDQPSNWSNDRTRAWYKIIPTSDVVPYKHYSHCRHYLAYARHHSETVKMNGIACRMDNGLWRQVK